MRETITTARYYFSYSLLYIFIIIFFYLMYVIDLPAQLVRRDPWMTGILLLADGAMSWLQNLLAFTILNHVTPLTYAVANATKRICVITFSLMLLGNPITLPNVVGMFLAILGVLGYNKVRLFMVCFYLRHFSSMTVLPQMI